MTRKTSSGRTPAAAERIHRIQQQIAAIDDVCSGHLHERTKVCGKPGCRCAEDVSCRHGPYFVWSRRQKGRLVQTNVSFEQAKRFARAIRNWRRIQLLLKRWERESARAIRRASDSSS